jgi:carboxylesterase type B
VASASSRAFTTPPRRSAKIDFARAWVAFARRGNPGWAAYNTTDRPTMFFDLNGRVEIDPFGTERRIWEEKR